MANGTATINVNCIGTDELIDRVRGMKQLVRAVEALCDDHARRGHLASVDRHVRKLRAALKRMQPKGSKE